MSFGADRFRCPCTQEDTCDEATRLAESSCKDTNGCVGCSDFNFGDDCDSNTREHCAEIECCPVCEAEIRAMFACEHGTSCGEEFTCCGDVAPADCAATDGCGLAPAVAGSCGSVTSQAACADTEATEAACTAPNCLLADDACGAPECDAAAAADCGAGCAWSEAQPELCYTVTPDAYYGVRTLVSQTDAEAACVANGGNLASMHSDADHLVVMRACNEVSDTGNCWIGLNDADEEGTFVWTDGSALDYENWNAGEPNAWCALPPLSAATPVY